MHICLVGLEVLSLLIPGYENYRTGGEQVQVSLLAKALSRKGFKVSVVTLDYGQPQVCEHAGITIIKSYAPEAGLPVLRFIHPKITKLWQALKMANADVYYTSCAGFQVGIIAHFCQKYGRKSVFRIAHDNDCEPTKLLIKTIRDKRLYEYGLRRQHRILAQSVQQQLALKQNYGVDSTVATMLVDSPDRIYDWKERDIDILWVNNIRQFKRPDVVIQLANFLPDTTIHMIGGPNEPALYQSIEAAATQRKNVVFHGPIPYHSIAPYYNRAKVFINTSDTEGFPNSYLQAWIRGTPTVVFFDPDDVISQNHLGYRTDNLQEMASTITAMLTQPDHWQLTSRNCQIYMHTHYGDDTVLIPYLDAFQF
jgi:glycosyltransferase involved in cell wall biosynthesis